MAEERTVDAIGTEVLTEIALYHKEWVRICTTLVGSYIAEDIVQDMYLKLFDLKPDMNYYRPEKTINKYYIYKTLRNLCMDYHKGHRIELDIDEVTLPPVKEDAGEYEAMDKLYDKVHAIMNTWSAYDARLFELYMYSGLTYRDISYGTTKVPKLISRDNKLSQLAVESGAKISVNSIFTTINNCKELLKAELSEDFEDYYNGEFDLIKRLQ